jgi:hypothetical protein
MCDENGRSAAQAAGAPLRRWLVARTWSADKAEHSLRDHAAWRSEFPNNSVTEVGRSRRGADRAVGSEHGMSQAHPGKLH